MFDWLFDVSIQTWTGIATATAVLSLLLSLRNSNRQAATELRQYAPDLLVRLAVLDAHADGKSWSVVVGHVKNVGSGHARNVRLQLFAEPGTEWGTRSPGSRWTYEAMHPVVEAGGAWDEEFRFNFKRTLRTGQMVQAVLKCEDTVGRAHVFTHLFSISGQPDPARSEAMVLSDLKRRVAGRRRLRHFGYGLLRFYYVVRFPRAHFQAIKERRKYERRVGL